MPVFGYRFSPSRHVLKPGQPVCITAVYNPAGEFKPVAFGVEMEGFRYRHKIKSVKAVKDRHGVFTFECEYIDLGTVKTVLLVFDVMHCRWMVG
jgi:hypothetical protein